MLKMRKTNLFVAALAAVLLGAVTGASVLIAQQCGVESTFDSDLEDWSALNPSHNNVYWSSTGGNPTGCMKSKDIDPHSGAQVIAPSGFLGDWSDLDGIGYVRYDSKVFDLSGFPITNEPRITITGPAGTASYTFAAPCTTFWQTYQVSLTEALWTVNPPGAWDALLANVTELRLGADYTKGRDINGFDNICVGPTAPIQHCLVQPTVLDFDTIFVGSSTNKTFMIKSSGDEILTGSVSESCLHYSIVSTVPPDDPYVLAPNDSLMVTVRFAPSANGTHVCTIDTGDDLCSNVFCTGIGIVQGMEDIPTLSEWGYIVLILSLVTISIFTLRRRRRFDRSK